MIHRQLISRAAEGLLIFVGIPLLFYFNIVPIPKLIALVLVTALCVFILWVDPSYHFQWNVSKSLPDGFKKRLFIRSSLVALALAGITFLLQPNQLFNFPRQRPFLWLLVIGLYPLLSALPQEFLYRTFFFHRYLKLFNSIWSLIIASASLFSFLHIVYDNIWAPILAFAGGLIFADSYRRHQSLFWVTVEHAIYGCLVFTVGLGHYFFEGF